MKKNKDFTKFTKRNTHKRKAKEEAKRALMKAISETGVGMNNVKLNPSISEGPIRRSKGTTVRGIYGGSKNGYGFLSVEDRERDIFIPQGASRGAIDGDYVEAVYRQYVGPDGEDRTEGRVTAILEVGRRSIIGRFTKELRRHGRRVYYAYVLEPDDPKISITPIVTDSCGAVDGDKVEALLKRDAYEPTCQVVRIFGEDGSFDANYGAILAECDIITDFSEEELSTARELADRPLSNEGREDLRSQTIFTIDGEGAKDLDDAISLRRLPGGGWRLGVHIADVSYYVTERTPLDRCVMQRGNSVYFIDKVVPMLPPALSNGACSLTAGEDKYAISALIDLDPCGEITSLRLTPSIIRSSVRGVYSEVNLLLSGKANREIKEKYKKVTPSLRRMEELYTILLERSNSRGAIDFDADEAIISLDPDGRPISIDKRERGVSERMIEQFMLTANEAVATYLSERSIPCVYRIHETPPEDNLDSLWGYLESLGFDMRRMRGKTPTNADLSAILTEAEQRGLSDAVSYTMLRAMAKAKYSEENKGHFGLGIEKYCHFTSPIRRLSDLATHRIIRRVLFEGKRPEQYTSYARRAASAATDGEGRATRAERRIEDLYKVLYMSEYIGNEYEAAICSITSFGIFVTLDNTCEGLIPISEIGGVPIFDERNLTIRSQNRTYRIADRITVRLEEAQIDRAKLRFSIVDL